MPKGKIPQKGDDWRKLGDRPPTNFNSVEFPEDIQDNEDRPSFRIIRCCGNCAYFWYRKNNTRRGVCKWPLRKDIGTGHENYKKYPGTHITCVCDNHSFRGIGYSLNSVTNYCGAEFLGDDFE